MPDASVWHWIASGVGFGVAIGGAVLAVLGMFLGMAGPFALLAGFSTMAGLLLMLLGIACAVLPWFVTDKAREA